MIVAIMIPEVLKFKNDILNFIFKLC